MIMVAGFLIAYTMSSLGAGSRPAEPSARRSAAELLRPGPQIVFVLVVDSRCRTCSTQAYADLVARALESMSSLASSRRYTLTTLGVALDPSPEAGWDFLRSLGKFDQMAVGASWANELLLGLPHSGLPPVGSVPQLLVYGRRIDSLVDPAATPFSPGFILASHRRVLAVLRGDAELRDWLDAGAPIRTY